MAKQFAQADVPAIAEFIRSKSDDQQVVIGPVTWQPSDGAKARMEYFIIAVSSKADGFHATQIVIEDEADKAEILMALAQTQPPLIMHSTDDELYMARLCETLWPSDRTTSLRKAVEAERA